MAYVLTAAILNLAIDARNAMPNGDARDSSRNEARNVPEFGRLGSRTAVLAAYLHASRHLMGGSKSRVAAAYVPRHRADKLSPNGTWVGIVGSVRLGTRELDHLGPLLGFNCDEPREVGG